MASLPQLIEEDIEVLQSALDELLRKSEAYASILIDKGGPVVCERGDTSKFDTVTIGALAAGAFGATHAMADRVGECNFASIYQQGDHTSILMCNVDENLLLLVIFKATLSVGVVKYYATSTILKVAEQMQQASVRAPGASLDLVSMNVMDASPIFRKQSP